MRRRGLVALLAVVAFLAPAAVAAAALPLVAIDAGHGGRDTGAVGVLPDGTPTGLTPRTDARGRTLLYEKDVTLDVAFRLDQLLQARGYPTVMTRTTDNGGGDVPYTTAKADLAARTRIANETGAQIFVSVHENSLNSRSTGTETYHFYYASPAARALAVLVHQEVVLRLGLHDRGVRQAGFYVLKHTVMPAILVEGAFLSNPEEALQLARPEVRQALAEGIGAGIQKFVDGGGVVPGAPAYGAPVSRKPLVIRYRVTAGAFRARRDALARAKRVRRAGFDAVIRSRYTPRVRRSLFYVVTGQFVYLQNARDQRAALRRAGFPGRIGGAG
ncbi:MAG: N-acetylmuramoyl-L-alanine amidase [Actinomycetota bacterium]